MWNVTMTVRKYAEVWNMLNQQNVLGLFNNMY